MKAFNKIFVAVIALSLLLLTAANIILLNDSGDNGREYRVEINRLETEIREKGFENADLSGCDYVTDIKKYGENFYNTESDYIIREIGGELYRFDYSAKAEQDKSSVLLIVNIFICIMALAVTAVLLFIRQKILVPFEKMSDLPYHLSKGNLNTPLKENRSRFFGKFVWGLDMLRETLEQHKRKELQLQKEKKTLLLSLSHDIKTPLSAIKLYSKALSTGLYPDSEKQREIAESINSKADEIEDYVSRIIGASREDFLSLEVNMGEFYLSELIKTVEQYYNDKLALVGTEICIEKFGNCLIKGDIDRSNEVFQNIIENAVKYGDGKRISIDFSEEEGCILITVKNGGCTLSGAELPHIFESFWRGSNAEKKEGTGLGLYICRQLMHKMGGEVFAGINGDIISITTVFVKA